MHNYLHKRFRVKVDTVTSSVCKASSDDFFNVTDDNIYIPGIENRLEEISNLMSSIEILVRQCINIDTNSVTLVSTSGGLTPRTCMSSKKSFSYLHPLLFMSNLCKQIRANNESRIFLVTISKILRRDVTL